MKKLKSIITSLNIKFTRLNLDGSDSNELFEFVWRNNHYEINSHMLNVVAQQTANFNQAVFDTQNFTAIKNSGSSELINYINRNLESYVKMVYVKLENNTKEPEKSLLEILNNKDLDLRAKLLVIKKTQTIISDLAETTSVEIDKMLLQELKVKPIWDNLIHNYEQSERQISEEAIHFINHLENAKELGLIKVPPDNKDEDTNASFQKELLETDKISDASYKEILAAITKTEVDISAIGRTKVNLLIHENILNLDSVTYELLKDHHDGAHITLLEDRKSDFINEISEFEIDQDDLLMILRSSIFNASEKGQILQELDESVFINSLDVQKEIGVLILGDEGFDPTSAVVRAAVLNAKISSGDRVKIFNQTHSNVDHTFITEFLNSLGEPYSEVTIPGKRPLLEGSGRNAKLVSKLHQLEYISSFDEEDKGIRIITYRPK